MGITVRFGTAAMPITWANDCTERVHTWLRPLLVKAPSFWVVVDGIASYFHPDYLVDQKTRQFKAEIRGAFVYFQMERGEFNKEVIKGLAPTLFKLLPSKSRGIPSEYHFYTAITAACLVVHVHQNLYELMREKNCGEADIFRYLYWHQRFFSLWERTMAAKPPNLNLTLVKRRAASNWHEQFRDYHFSQSKGGKKLRSIAHGFASKKKQKPSFDTVYRWALKNRNSLEKNMCTRP